MFGCSLYVFCVWFVFKFFDFVWWVITNLFFLCFLFNDFE